MAEHENTLDTLEKLIETCRDGQEGYRDAGEHTNNPELKHFFNQQSLERAQFAGELENCVQRLGKHDVDRGTSVSNKLHRAWFDLKQKLGGGDESVLSSVEAGEDNAKKHYQDALQEPLPADIRDIVSRQADHVFAAHDHVRDLRDRLKRVA